jgi:hypothetical protein
MFMLNLVAFAISILFLFGCASAEMPNEGKRTSPNPPSAMYRDSEECEKGRREKQPLFIPGEVLVTFKPGLTRDEIDGIREAYGLSLIKRIEDIGVYRFKIPHGSTVTDMVEALNRDPQVEYAEPNYTVSITVQ